MSKTASRRKPEKPSKLGKLPEWDLTDLYPGLDSPQIRSDLEQGDRDCEAFEQRFKGRLAALAAGEGGGRALAEAVKQYEAIDDRLGRLISYASLLYAGNTTDPDRAKFYGDVQERITAASLHMLFFTLELNRIPDEKLEAAMGQPALGHYRPWVGPITAGDGGGAQGKALPARRPGRGALPRKVSDRLFPLEPVVRRNDRRPAFQNRWQAAGDRVDAQSAAGRRWQETQGGCRSA